jgi:Sec-independent protein translocase protein TatA
MKHPTRETWISYLYDEIPVEERAAQRSHLDSCAECRTQLAQWQSAAAGLDEWKLPARRMAWRRVTFIRWAAAAAIVGMVVFGGARLNALANEVKQLRAEVQRNAGKETDAALARLSDQAAKSATTEAQALVAAVAQQWEQKRVLDQQATVAALQQLSARQVQDHATLRKELETVAVFSEAGWQRTQNQISSLADTTASISNDK